MAVEIERKFLVKDHSFKDRARNTIHIKQGFLNLDPQRIVRVRIAEGEAWITVKGPSNLKGTTRFEWESQISVAEAEELLVLVEGAIIEKNRYKVPQGSHIFDVDEFFGNNNGLVLAEVELNNEDEEYPVPSWLGEEVTGDIKYYNAQLSINPFTQWKD